MKFTIEIEREKGTQRWIAEVIEVPGAMAYGNSPDEAVCQAASIAFIVKPPAAERPEVTDDDIRAIFSKTDTPKIISHGSIGPFDWFKAGFRACESKHK